MVTDPNRYLIKEDTDGNQAEAHEKKPQIMYYQELQIKTQGDATTNLFE